MLEKTRHDKHIIKIICRSFRTQLAANFNWLPSCTASAHKQPEVRPLAITNQHLLITFTCISLFQYKTQCMGRIYHLTTFFRFRKNTINTLSSSIYIRKKCFPGSGPCCILFLFPRLMHQGVKTFPGQSPFKRICTALLH